MSNNLIENKTNVFYTVQLKDALFVKKYEVYGGDVRDVMVTNKEIETKSFTDLKTATKVASFVGGAVIKHTRTSVVTEVTEEIRLTGEVK